MEVRILRRATSVAGGVQPLSDILGVAAGDLADWVAGRTPPPLEALVRAVELTVVSDCRAFGAGGAAQRLACLLAPEAQQVE